jgi:2'-5' RNA ligase
MKKKTAIVYFLLLAKPERDLFCEIVRILRKEFHTPDFDPHLTLLVTTKTHESPKKVLQLLRSRPIRLKVREVAFAAKFTKTLFVRFKSSPALRKLALDLGRAAHVSTKGPKDPHVSLLYKKIPRRVKRELAKVIKLPLRSVRFDSVAAVRLTLPVRTASDVEKWKIIARKSLRP